MWRQAVVSGGNLDGLKGARLLLLEPLHDAELLRQLGRLGLGSLWRGRVGNGDFGRALGSPQKECSRLTETGFTACWGAAVRADSGATNRNLRSDGEEMQS